jgi:hypothetical protein
VARLGGDGRFEMADRLRVVLLVEMGEPEERVALAVGRGRVRKLELTDQAVEIPGLEPLPILLGQRRTALNEHQRPP